MIISHQKVYKDRSGPISYLNTSFFSIDTQFHFNWSSEFAKNSSYARFLKAVGLARVAPQNYKKTLAIAANIPKTYTNDYVPNPQAKAAQTPSSVTIKELPAETVVEKVTEKENVAATADTVQIQQEEISSNLPEEAKMTPAKANSSNVVTPSRSNIPPHDLDSDSNYSFSEHFEVPSSTTTTLNESETRKSNGPMDALPDIIPLSSMDDDVAEQDIQLSTTSQGISMCVNSKVSSSSGGAAQDEENLPDCPSEAKIIMAHDQTQYLFSPEGRQFLIDSAKQCNVNVRMDFKEYGYVLVIYGLKKDQEDLQLLLLRRNQEVKRKTTEFQSQKPPKRIDVLIRFMRDGINSLTGDLGNAKGHYFRIKELERMNTKNGFKLAERKRRLLNMILFGQAGLNNGSMHLDQLLLILKRLVDEHKLEENASAAMRNKIEEHWKVIFSPIAHPNYESLLQSYGRLDIKNRIAGLNIEPAVLGLQGSGRKVQQPAQPRRERIASPPPPPPVWQHDKNRSPKQQLQQQTPSPPLWQQEERAPPPPSMQQQNRNNNNNNNNAGNRLQKQRVSQLQRQQVPLPPIWQHEEQQQQQQHQHINNKSRTVKQQQRPHPYAKSPGQQQQQVSLLPCHNMQQRTPAKLQLHRSNGPLQSECVKLLAGMEQSSCNTINTDASKPSVFWSRESLKYLDELFKITANPETLERLNRVLDRSRSGQLSHNDYRAVIRLHSLMEPH